MGYWLKLYTDVLDDPKYFRLSEEAKLGMFELMLVAKKVENGELTGNLPGIDDIAFHTRKCPSHWEKILPELEEIGFVVIERDIPKLKNYVKRQGRIPDEIRSQQARKKRNDGVMSSITIASQDGHNLVTECDGEKIREETEEEEDKRIVDENAPTPYSLLSKTFVEISGIPELTGGIKNYADSLKEMVDKGVTPEILEEAILEMRDKDLTIATPKSCINACAIVMGRRNGKTRKKKDDDPERYLKGEYGDVGKHW